MSYERKHTLVKCKVCGKEWMKADDDTKKWGGHCLRCSLTKERNPFYGKRHSKETIKKLSQASSGPNNANYGKKRSPATIQKLIDANRGTNNPNFGKHPSEETRQKMSDSHRGKLVGDKNPMYGKRLSDKHRRALSKSSIKYWRGRPKSEAHKKSLSASLKALWKGPDYQKMVQASRQARPNKFEGRVFSLLNDISPGEFRYSGDFSVWINGKNPDFISIKRDIVVEANGDYWHTPDEDAERVRHFDLSGYRCLIVRDGELKNNPSGVRLALESALATETNRATGTI